MQDDSELEAELDPDMGVDEDNFRFGMSEDFFEPSPIFWRQPDGAVYAYPFGRYWGWRLDSPRQAAKLRSWYAYASGFAPFIVVIAKYLPFAPYLPIAFISGTTLFGCAYACRIVRLLPRAPVEMPKDVYLRGVALELEGNGLLKWAPILVWVLIAVLGLFLIVSGFPERWLVLAFLLLMVACERRLTALRRIIKAEFPFRGT